MNKTDIDEMLAQTLADTQLSRSERKALKQVIEDADLDTDQLGYIRHRVFEMARAETGRSAERRLIDWIEEAVKVFTPKVEAASSTRVYTSPGDDCWQRIVGLFASCRRAADVCVFTITDDRIADAMIEARRRGVALRVISDDDKATDRGSDIVRLSEAGVSVRVDRSPHHMHHKFAVFDDATALTGSYNWTRSAAKHNRENVLITDEKSVVGAYRQCFAELWDSFG